MHLSLNTYKDEVFVIKDFVNKELDALNTWALDNYTKPFFKDSNMGIPGTGFTTRYNSEKDEIIKFPKEAYEIKEKIVKALDIKSYKNPFRLQNNEIVCNIAFNDAEIRKHKDPIWYPETYTFHCNILSSKSEQGGNTYINDELFSVNAGDLLCYDVSNKEHVVDKVIGDSPRILWIFGFCLPDPQT